MRGSILVRGVPQAAEKFRDAMAAGLGTSADDRKALGISGRMTILENSTIASL